MKNPSSPLRRFGSFMFPVYFVGVMFFVLKLNPLLFSPDSLSSNLHHTNFQHLIFPQPPEKPLPWEEDIAGESTGKNTKAHRFSAAPYLNRQMASPKFLGSVKLKMAKVLHGDKKPPTSWVLAHKQIYLIYPQWLIASNTNGTELWNFSLPQKDSSHLFLPDFSKNSAFVSSSSGHIYSLHKTTGKMQWFLALRTPLSARPLLFKDGLYALTQFHTKEKIKAQLTKIHPGSGKLLWISKHEFQPTGHSIAAHPQLDLIVVNSTHKVLAFDSHSGDLAWSTPMEAPIHTVVTVVGEALYLADKKGLIFALHAKTGHKIWQHPLKTTINASLTYIPKHELIVALDKNSYLQAIDRHSGKKKWVLKTEHHTTSNLIQAMRLSHHPTRPLTQNTGDWFLWSPCGKSKLCIINPQNGQAINAVYLSGELQSPPYLSSSGLFLSLSQPVILQKDGTKKKLDWSIVHYIGNQ